MAQLLAAAGGENGGIQKQFFQKVVENKICKFCKETFGNLKIRRIFAVRFALKIRAIFLAVFANFSQHETGSLNYW